MSQSRITGRSFTDLRSVEDNWGEPRRHLTVQADLDTCLDLVLRLDERIQEFVGMDHGLTVVCHQSNKGGVPLVDNL